MHLVNRVTEGGVDHVTAVEEIWNALSSQRATPGRWLRAWPGTEGNWEVFVGGLRSEMKQTRFRSDQISQKKRIKES